jgi:hypothetical protein
MPELAIPAGVITEFKMDPEKHDFVFRGTQLKTGMRVLLSDKLFWRTIAFSEHDIKRMLEQQRWCTIGEIEFRPIPQYNHEGDRVIGIDTLVSFEAIYDDGHVTKRTYNQSYAWYAEKPIGEYAQIVRTGLRQAFPDLVGV